MMAITSKDSQGDIQSPGLGKHFRKLGANLSLIFSRSIFLHSRTKESYFQNNLVFLFYAGDLVNACISLLIRKPC